MQHCENSFNNSLSSPQLTSYFIIPYQVYHVDKLSLKGF